MYSLFSAFKGFLRWKESGFHGWPVFSKRDIVGGPERHRCVWGWSTKVSSPLHASVSRAELYLIGFYVPALCIICLVPPHELSCGNIKMHSKKITLNQSIEFVVHFTIPDSNSRKTLMCLTIDRVFPWSWLPGSHHCLSQKHNPK